MPLAQVSNATERATVMGTLVPSNHNNLQFYFNLTLRPKKIKNFTALATFSPISILLSSFSFCQKKEKIDNIKWENSYCIQVLTDIFIVAFRHVISVWKHDQANIIWMWTFELKKMIFYVNSDHCKWEKGPIWQSIHI